MKRLNIGVLCDDDCLKSDVLTNILLSFDNNLSETYQTYLSNKEDTNTFFPFLFCKYNNLDINFLDIPYNKNITSDNFFVLQQCNSIIFIINCNNYNFNEMQTYLYTLYTLGIKNICFLVINLENYTVHDGKMMFDKIKKELKEKTKQVSIKNYYILPYSIKSLEHTKWFLEFDDLNSCICKFKYEDLSKLPNNFIVNDYFNIDKSYSAITCTIRSGILKEKDVIYIQPNNLVVNIMKIEKNHEEINEAYPYDNVGLLINNINIDKGSICKNFLHNIKSNEQHLKPTNYISCKIIVIENKINQGDELEMLYNNKTVKCIVDKIHKKLKLYNSTLEYPECVYKNSPAIVKFKLNENIFIDRFDSQTVNGRVLFNKNDGSISCIGIVKSVYYSNMIICK